MSRQPPLATPNILERQLGAQDSRLKPETVLVIGSGPIVIGQAAEFDYSGTQACLACREAGVRSILVNSNPATIQTDNHIADVVYIEPLTLDSLTEIIRLERPEGLIATVGGQTALNLVVELDEAGILCRYGVRVLGTGLSTIRRGEDRGLFAETLREAHQPILNSRAVSSVEAALVAASAIGYPVMCRSAFALGGAGSGFAENPAHLMERAASGLRRSGSDQVLIEESVYGWSEIEYEVLRDGAGNALVVCNMENIDPMGVHTGDSIVVAPSQTLSDEQYHMLRAAAIDVVRTLGVEGACNVQFALNHDTGQYFVIEVNPRLSRSSALASKATGYPIAKVATRIALGDTLPEIKNDITGTSAFFEPALDYVIVKIPRWPFDKFSTIDSSVGTSMRSTGEVMALGRTFEEAMDKAIRSLDQPHAPSRDLRPQLSEPNAYRLPALLKALKEGWDASQVSALTSIHPWFIDRLAELARFDTNTDVRHENPVFKMVDTCSGEFEAQTPYFYGACGRAGENEAEPLPGPKALILGSGPIRIGQGIEFDYSTVHACHALDECGVKSIIINNNPETVSTDYSTSDRLYFEPLDLKAVIAVLENEAPGLLGVIPQFGGQTAIDLVQPLSDLGIKILGTDPRAIDLAEDRAKMSALVKGCGIPAPEWWAVSRWDDLYTAVQNVGLPALLRPSYVLSGQGMVVVRNIADLDRYIHANSHVPLAKPLLVDRFLENAVEVNVDAVSDGTDTLMVVMEQLDECGVHSGDSAEVYPVQSFDARTLRTVENHTRTLARSLGIAGLMNVQYAVLEGVVYVLEVNPRASRSVPFASKASGIPLADIAIRAILGEQLCNCVDGELLRVGWSSGSGAEGVSVKSVVFPFRVFPSLDPLLGPEMQSTGESMGTGHSFGEAYWKSLLGGGMKALPFGRPVCLSMPDENSTRETLIAALRSAGCAIIASPQSCFDPRFGVTRPLDDVHVEELSMVIALGRSAQEIALLKRATERGVACITTSGGTRALATALAEGVPTLQPRAQSHLAFTTELKSSIVEVA